MIANEALTTNTLPPTIPFYIESNNKEAYDRWFSEVRQSHAPKLSFPHTRFGGGTLWRNVTIDWGGVLSECVQSALGYETEWLTPDPHYYGMLARFMALVDLALSPALMGYACRFEFDYGDAPEISVKGMIFANTLQELDGHAEDVARAVTALWPKVRALFNECISTLRIKKL